MVILNGILKTPHFHKLKKKKIGNPLPISFILCFFIFLVHEIPKSGSQFPLRPPLFSTLVCPLRAELPLQLASSPMWLR